MKFRFPATLILAAVIAPLILAHAQEAPPSKTLTLDEYRAELGRMADEVGNHPEGAAALRASLPQSWTVQTGGGDMRVSLAWLHEGLKSMERDPAKAAEVQLRLRLLRDSADGFWRGPQFRDVHGKVDAILSRREFRAVRGPTRWDELQARVNQWIYELLRKIFGSTAGNPQIGQALVWVLIAFGLSVLAIWIKRSIFDAPRPASLDLAVAAVPRRSWREWMQQALAAAQGGDYRDAIHLAYWAAITRLDDAGVWRPDRSRTPREHLRLLPAAHPDRPALAALTRRFELVWYGLQPASAGDFQQSVSELESLGCRSS